MSQQELILTGHNFFEKQDAKTNKILCLECGGKGFYLLVSSQSRRGEFVNCEYCEKGFKYIERGLDFNGKQKTKGS